MNPTYDEIVALAKSVRGALETLTSLDIALANHMVKSLPKSIERASNSVNEFLEHIAKVK